MSSDSLVAFHYILILYVLALLQSVSGYVAQSPSSTVTTIPDLAYDKANASSIMAPNSATTELSQEERPFDFKVEYNWKKNGIALNRLALLNTVIFDMAYVATKGWNTPVAIAKFPRPFHINIGFLSDRSGPGLKVKHVMWALDEVFDNFVNNQRYAPGSFVVDITPTRLGLGNVQSASTPTTSTTTSATHVSDDILGTSSVKATVALDDMALASKSAFMLNGPVNGSTTRSILPKQTLLESPSLNTRREKEILVDLQYRPNGVTFHDAQIFNTSLKTLIKAAEPSDMFESIGAILSTYNDIEDLTFSLVSKPYVKDNELAWLDCITSINAVIFWMAKQGPEGRWAEIDGFIRDGKDVIGRFCIDKGDLTGLDPGDVCTAPFPEGVSFSRG